jgi:hypothetical protein
MTDRWVGDRWVHEWVDPRDKDNPPYEDPLNPGIIIRDYCSCEGEDHDYDCELDPDNE